MMARWRWMLLIPGSVILVGVVAEAGDMPKKRIAGKALVIDGRTLRFPQQGVEVRLAGIDVCELPQWSFEPDISAAAAGNRLVPVPCGPFAKAMLKRLLERTSVDCQILSYQRPPGGLCVSGGRDLALELLRRGWAKVSSASAADRSYISAQREAMVARLGMWGTFLLDMNEWRQTAIDRTERRRPIADYNLLMQRRSEISPPFADAARRPLRRDQ